MNVTSTRMRGTGQHGGRSPRTLGTHGYSARPASRHYPMSAGRGMSLRLEPFDCWQSTVQGRNHDGLAYSAFTRHFLTFLR